MYQDLINEAIRARDDLRQADRGSDAGEWHPSSLANDCKRQAVYSYIGEPVSNDRQDRNIRIMDRGTEIHEEVQAMVIRSILAKGGQPSDFLAEVKVDAFGIKGSSDGLLAVADGRHYDEVGNPEDGLQPVYELQEYKSISTVGLKYLKPKPFGKPGPLNAAKPKPEHVKQARIYYGCLETQGYLLDGIRIVYIDRDDWSVTEFEVEPWDDIEFGTFLTEMDVLNSHVEEGTLPERMPDDYWLCKYCPYFTTCKG